MLTSRTASVVCAAWLLLLFAGNSYISEAQETVQWGFSETVPVMKDYDGDGILDFAVYSESTGEWYIYGSVAGFSKYEWGASDTVPVPADYDGDGKADIAIYHGKTGTWYIYGSVTGFIAYEWGFPGAIPVPADYDNDGQTDLGVYYPANGMWYLMTSLPLPVLGELKKWTVLCYCNGDNNLEEDLLDMFVRLADVGSDENINLIVQLDRIPGESTNYGDWTISERFFVTEEMTPMQINAVTNWGDGIGGREVNMADPATLKNFINWTTRNYPAENYALVIADHGFGWNGTCIDSTSSDSYLFIKELKEALADAYASMDLIVLDACLMQMIEVAYEIKDTGPDFMVGSEDYGLTDWPFDILMRRLASAPELSPREFALSINELLYDYYCVQQQTPALTISTVDLNRIEDLTDSIRALAISMMSTNCSFADIQSDARQVMTQVNRSVIKNKFGSDWDAIAHGISIYFPDSSTGFAPSSFFYYTPKMTSFAQAASWREFLDYFFNPLSHSMNPKIYEVRNRLRTFDSENENLDLYYFCNEIVNY